MREYIKKDMYMIEDYIIVDDKYFDIDIETLIDTYKYKSDLEIKRELREKKIKRIMNGVN